MREPSWSLVPTAKWGLSKVGACQNNVLSVPPPPALVGLYSGGVVACAIPKAANRRVAKGAVRPRPTIRRMKARRGTRPAFTAATRSRKSCSFIGEKSSAGVTDDKGWQLSTWRKQGPFSSVQYGGQIGAGRLVVEADRHQGHLMHEAQPVAQTPAEQFAIARRDQKSASWERRRRTNQCHDALVGGGNGVPKECDAGGIRRDLAQMLDDAACSLRNGVPQFPSAVVAVDALAQFVAFGNICLVCLPDLITRKFDRQRAAVDLRHRLAAVEAEIGVKAQGPVVVGGLQQPHAG